MCTVLQLKMSWAETHCRTRKSKLQWGQREWTDVQGLAGHCRTLGFIRSETGNHWKVLHRGGGLWCTWLRTDSTAVWAEDPEDPKRKRETGQDRPAQSTLGIVVAAVKDERGSEPGFGVHATRRRWHT